MADEVIAKVAVERTATLLSDRQDLDGLARG